LGSKSIKKYWLIFFCRIIHLNEQKTMSFTISNNWRGGFRSTARTEDNLRYAGGTKSVGTRESISVPFSPTSPLPRCVPVLQHSANPFLSDGEFIGRTVDSARIVQPDSSSVAHGRGTLTWFDVVVYEGQFSDGWRDGHGVGLIYIEPAHLEKASSLHRPEFAGVYDGVWRYSLRHGFGTMLFVDGRSFKGCWIDDKPAGVGQITYPDGSVLLGTFAGCIDKPVGACVLRYADGTAEIHFYQRPGHLDNVRPATDVAKAEAHLNAKLTALSQGAVPYTPTMGARGIPNVGSGGAAVGVAHSGGGGGGGGGAVSSGNVAAPTPMVSMGAPAEQQPPTLKLKRVLKDWVANDGPALSQRVQSEAGVSVEFQVNADSFNNHATAGGTAITALADPATVGHPILAALKQIAADPMGKESLAESLKTIVIVNDESVRGPEFKFSGSAKTLTITLPLVRGVGRAGLVQDMIVKFLEKQL
jgi:hypothetical protein